LKREEIVSLKVLHNSEFLQISISVMSVVEASLTLSTLCQTQCASSGKSEIIAKCAVFRVQPDFCF